MNEIIKNLGYIILFVIIVIIYISRKNSRGDNRTKEQIITEEKSINRKAFSKKDYLLTPTELKFYKILKQVTDKMEFNLFCQVPMYALIKCTDYKEFNRIKSKSIDFVVTQKNCKILLCIELDDITHNKQQRIDRDNFVNDVFETTNTKLIRVPTQSYYDIEKLEQLIKQNIEYIQKEANLDNSINAKK